MCMYPAMKWHVNGKRPLENAEINNEKISRTHLEGGSVI